MYDDGKVSNSKLRIARTDLVNFMIDDLVGSSLGFLKRKKNKKKNTRNVETRDIAFILLKSILCIISIVISTVLLGDIIHDIARRLQELNAAWNNSCTRYPSRDKRDDKKKTKLQREQYDDIFSQLIVPNFFNRIIKLLDSLDGLCQSVRVECRKTKTRRAISRRKKRLFAHLLSHWLG